MPERPEPQPGEVWHERRRMYELRQVEVVEVDESFVYVRTIVNERGGAVTTRRRPTRVRRALWHSYWKPVESESEGRVVRLEDLPPSLRSQVEAQLDTPKRRRSRAGADRVAMEGRCHACGELFVNVSGHRRLELIGEGD